MDAFVTFPKGYCLLINITIIMQFYMSIPMSLTLQRLSDTIIQNNREIDKSFVFSSLIYEGFPKILLCHERCNPVCAAADTHTQTRTQAHTYTHTHIHAQMHAHTYTHVANTKTWQTNFLRLKCLMKAVFFPLTLTRRHARARTRTRTRTHTHTHISKSKQAVLEQGVV